MPSVTCLLEKRADIRGAWEQTWVEHYKGSSRTEVTDHMTIRRNAYGSGLPVLLLVGVTLMSAPAAQPQAEPALPALSAEQVVQKLTEQNRERAQGLEHYVARRSYRLAYRGFPRSADATMEVQVNFDAPSTKRFTVISATGPKLVQDRVFTTLLDSEEQAADESNRTRSELSSANYTFSLAGTEGTDYVLNVEPKVQSRFLYRGKIWVDAQDFAVTRIEAQPARNPSFWTTHSAIHHTYQKVDGRFYLPKENKTVTSVRMGGVATLTIEYESYQITTTGSAVARNANAPSSPGAMSVVGLNEQIANLISSQR